jgi:predicted esterase
MKPAKLRAVWLWLMFGCAASASIGATIDADASQPSPGEAPYSQPIVGVTIADVPMLVAAPRRITKRTPVIIMYHGFGPPNTPQLLSQALPPIPDALTVYPSLPLIGARIPAGGVDELLRRQREDYVGEMLYPSILGAAQELPQIIKALSKRYGLSKASPLILFGFSAGGAAVLLSLTESRVRPHAVVVVNSPLSIVQAVDGYERQTKEVFTWTEKAREAAAHYDLEKSAERISELNPRAAVLILQSDQDAGFSVGTAQSAAAALKKADARHGPVPDISARTLIGSDHYVLTGPESAAAKQSILGWIAQQAFP